MKINYKDISITFKFRLEELENMIEVYTRQPKKCELEDGIRQDLRNIRIKVEDHNGNTYFYDESDCEEHGLGLEYDIEDIINKQGGTFDEEEVGKKQDT